MWSYMGFTPKYAQAYHSSGEGVFRRRISWLRLWYPPEDNKLLSMVPSLPVTYSQMKAWELTKDQALVQRLGESTRHRFPDLPWYQQQGSGLTQLNFQNLSLNVVLWCHNGFILMLAKYPSKNSLHLVTDWKLVGEGWDVRRNLCAASLLGGVSGDPF